MSVTHSEDPEDLQVLAHDTWPGYQSAFGVLFVAGLVYLAVIFASWKG